MKWWAKATSTVKAAKWHPLVLFLPPHIAQSSIIQPVPASRVVNHSQLSVYQGEMEPSEDHPSTHGCLTSLRKKTQQKQPGQLSAPVPACLNCQLMCMYSYRIDGEMCVLLLCTWKVSFFKSSHIYAILIKISMHKIPMWLASHLVHYNQLKQWYIIKHAA